MSDEPVWIQGDLFGKAAEIQQEALWSLDRLDFNRAVELLREAESIDPCLPNAAFYIQVGETALESGLDTAASAEEILDVWRRQAMPEPTDEAAGAPATVRFCEALSQRLLDLHPFGETGTADSGGREYPKGIFLLYVGKVREAFDELAALVRRRGEGAPTWWWGYYADAAYALQRERQANIGYLRLLAGEPRGVDWGTFRHQGLRDCFLRAAEEQGKDRAYPLWGYYAWEAGMLSIPPRNQFLPEMLDSRTDRELPNDEEARLRRFSLLVLIEQSRIEEGVDMERRSQMQQEAPELFARYLKTIGAK